MVLPGLSSFLEEHRATTTKDEEGPRVNPLVCLWGKIIYNILDRCLSNLLIAENATAFLKQLIPVLYILVA